MQQLSRDLRDLVARLITVHGEQGLSPTAEDWTAIFGCPADKPINILNLLRFRPVVATENGTQSGLSAYTSYGAGVAPAFARVGGKTLYFGSVKHIFGTAPSQTPGEEWEAAILTRYPSPRALADFWLDEEFIAAHEHRIDGVAASCVIVLSALREA